MHPYLVMTTLPDDDKALALGRTLVEERLAACVNLLPSVHSIYRWQGEVHFDREVLCLVKTTRDRFEALRARIVELHPYEVPEVVALPIEDGHVPYLSWLVESVEPSRPNRRPAPGAKKRAVPSPSRRRPAR